MKNKIYLIAVLLFSSTANSAAQNSPVSQGHFLSAIDYSLVCVDSIWYDTLNPFFINVRIFNGNVSHLNYPSTQIVSPANDTIGNPSNLVSFFAHLGNNYQTYTDTITQTGITNFSNYTFLISEGFGDTTVVITWCVPLAIPELTADEIKIYPNPVISDLNIQNNSSQLFQFSLYNSSREKIIDKMLKSKKSTIDLSPYTNGIYFYILTSDKNINKSGKIIKQ